MHAREASRQQTGTRHKQRNRTVELVNGLGEGVDALHVQVVRRLVQQQQVRVAAHQNDGNERHERVSAISL